jgi:hypothetical protein
MAAAEAAGVRRIVAQSYAAWPYERRGGWIKTEDDPLDPDPVPQMRRTLDAIRYLETSVLEGDPEGSSCDTGPSTGPAPRSASAVAS